MMGATEVVNERRSEYDASPTVRRPVEVSVKNAPGNGTAIGEVMPPPIRSRLKTPPDSLPMMGRR